MSWESFNNLISNSMGSFATPNLNPLFMQNFNFANVSNPSNFALQGLLNQNPYTSGSQTPLNFTFDMSMMTPSVSADFLESMYSNFVDELDARNKQFEQFISGLFNTSLTGSYSDDDTSYFSYDAKELKTKWSKKKPELSDGFYNKVVEIAKRIKCNPGDLMAVMNAESGLSATAVNKNGGATGLIQFMPETAKSLGTTTEKLKQMSPEQQLVYVEKYLRQAKKNAGFGDNDKIGAGTLYSLVYLPAYAKQDVLASAGSSYYDENTVLDINGDGKITKNELAQIVHSHMA